MILVAGLSPAWQSILVLPELHLGEVNRAAKAHWVGSGKVLNAGLAVHRLGTPTAILSILGGPAREPILAEFAEHGVLAEFLVTPRPTRVCTTVLDRSTGQVTELVENQGPLAGPEFDLFRERFAARAAQSSGCLLTGSLPAGCPAGFYRDLLAAAAGFSVLDIRGPELERLLDLRPTVVKPNRAELAATLGRALPDEAALLTAMRELNGRGAECVVVSQGAGPLLATTADWQLRVATPRVTVVNPIGSGDCLAAGIAVGLERGVGLPEAIRLGVAAAVENAIALLPARLDPTRVAERAASLDVHLESH